MARRVGLSAAQRLMYVWDELEAWTQDRGVILVDIIKGWLGRAGKIAKGSQIIGKEFQELLEKNAQIVGKESYRRFELASSDSVVSLSRLDLY